MTTTSILTGYGRMDRSIHERLVMGEWPKGVTTDQAVPLALLQTRVIDPEDLLPEKVRLLEAGRDRIFERLQKSLGVEENLVNTLTYRHRGLCMEIGIREFTRKHGFPTLNPEFLKWKNKDCYPAFSVYDVDSPACQIHCRISGPFRKAAVFIEPNMPDVLRKNFADNLLLAILGEECNTGRFSSITLSSRYDGAMPESVCDAIHKYRDLFEGVFIVANAPKWKRDAVAAIKPGDPLVIGVKDHVLYLIASYDLEPVEKVAMQVCLEGAAGAFRATN